MRHSRIPRRRDKPFVLLRHWRFGDNGFSRFEEEFRVPCEVLEGSEQAAMVFHECMKGCRREELWVLSMDDACRATTIVRVAVGTEDGVQVEPSLVLGAASISGCGAFVLGHNHPSGDPTPSLGDWVATSEMLMCSDQAGLELVDHVVLGDGIYVSMRSRNEGLFLGERGSSP